MHNRCVKRWLFRTIGLDAVSDQNIENITIYPALRRDPEAFMTALEPKVNDLNNCYTSQRNLKSLALTNNGNKAYPLRNWHDNLFYNVQYTVYQEVIMAAPRLTRGHLPLKRKTAVTYNEGRIASKSCRAANLTTRNNKNNSVFRVANLRSARVKTLNIGSDRNVDRGA